MDSKLTLKLDKDVIEKAKTYAHKNNVSLSKMVEKYFLTIVKEEKSTFKPTSLVNELSGIIKLDNDFDQKEDYINYLNKKYN